MSEQNAGATGATGVAQAAVNDTEAENLKKVLRDIIGITGDGQINHFQTHGGITTAEDIAYVDIDSLVGIFVANSQPSAMIKMHLRALKSWIDTSLENYDSVDVTDFDEETCKNLQRKLARVTLVVLAQAWKENHPMAQA